MSNGYFKLIAHGDKYAKKYSVEVEYSDGKTRIKHLVSVTPSPFTGEYECTVYKTLVDGVEYDVIVNPLEDYLCSLIRMIFKVSVDYRGKLVDYLSEIDGLISKYKWVLDTWSSSRIYRYCNRLELVDCIGEIRQVLEDHRERSRENYWTTISMLGRWVEEHYGAKLVSETHGKKKYYYYIVKDGKKLYVPTRIMRDLVRVLKYCYYDRNCAPTILSELSDYRDPRLLEIVKHLVGIEIDFCSGNRVDIVDINVI